MTEQEAATLEDPILVHLLHHRGHQVRFEADQWTTEFGILRAFATHDAQSLRGTLRALEMSRSIYRRVQYVIGYSEPKLVYSLTPAGYKRATESLQAGTLPPDLPLMTGTSLVPEFPNAPSPLEPLDPASELARRRRGPQEGNP